MAVRHCKCIAAWQHDSSCLQCTGSKLSRRWNLHHQWNLVCSARNHGRGKPIFEIITAVLAIIAIIRIAVANRNLQGTIVGTIVSYLFGYFVSWIVMMLVKIGLLMIGFSIIGALSAVAAIFWVADKIFKKKWEKIGRGEF